MLFFDYLHYSIYKFYSKKEKGAASSAAGIVGGFQAANVLTILMLVSIFVRQKTFINKFLAIGLFMIFQVFTYIRYIYKDNNSVSIIEAKWLSEPESARKRKGTYLWLYGLISVISFLGLAIYLGLKKL
jgi:hypothetical protein